jgi:hypothetical protein
VKQFRLFSKAALNEGLQFHIFIEQLCMSSLFCIWIDFRTKSAEKGPITFTLIAAPCVTEIVFFTSHVYRVDGVSRSVAAWTTIFVAGKNTKTKSAVSSLLQCKLPLHFFRKTL